MRVWRLVDHWAETIGGEGMPACGDDCTDAERALRRKTHDTIRRVTTDIEERMHLNTAVSSLMELVNELYAFSEGTAHGAPTRGEPPAGRVERTQTIAVLREAIDALVLMISPFAPHTAEELWQMLGHAGRPRARPAGRRSIRRWRRRTKSSCPCRSTARFARGSRCRPMPSEEQLRELALADAAVRTHTDGKTIRKVVVAKGPLVSVVVAIAHDERTAA